jgi:hypothetical protein
VTLAGPGDTNLSSLAACTMRIALVRLRRRCLLVVPESLSQQRETSWHWKGHLPTGTPASLLTGCKGFLAGACSAVDLVKGLLVSLRVFGRGYASLRRAPGFRSVAPETGHSLAVASRLARRLPGGLEFQADSLPFMCRRGVWAHRACSDYLAQKKLLHMPELTEPPFCLIIGGLLLCGPPDRVSCCNSCAQ